MRERGGREDAFLIVEHTGQRIPLGRQPTTIGRGPGNSVELDDDKASRNHAAVVFQDGRYAIQDIDSANGTYVNNQRVAGVQVLRDGDKIRIGRTVMSARLGTGAISPPPARTRRSSRPVAAVPNAATRAVPGGVPRSRSWGPLVGILVVVQLLVAIAVILFFALSTRSDRPVQVVRITATPDAEQASALIQPTEAVLLPTEAVEGTATEIPPVTAPPPEPTETLPEHTATLTQPSDTPSPTPTDAPPTLSATPEPPTAPPPTRRPTARPAEPGMIADFETFGTWKRGDEPNGTFAQTQEQVHGGSYAGKLAYDFRTAGNDYVVFTQQHDVGGTPNQISAWVYGDGSGHFLNVWVRDAGGQTWQFPLGRVQHTGWQQMTAWLDPGAPWPTTHIDGTDNGALDYPITFRALVLDDVPDGFSGSGVIYIDDLRAAQVSQPPPTQPPAATQLPARVVRFWADRTSIPAGSSTVLHWHVENVRAIYLDGAAVTGPDGQRTVSPAVTTTYRLRVVFAGGEETYEVTITVN